jgi:hypothetical protein
LASWAAGSGVRVALSTLRRNQNKPASAANVARPTARVLPVGPNFEGKERTAVVGLSSRRVTSCFVLFNEVPQRPQKRFSNGLSCRHLGQGVISSMSIYSLSVPFLMFIPATGGSPPLSLQECSQRIARPLSPGPGLPPRWPQAPPQGLPLARRGTRI